MTIFYITLRLNSKLYNRINMAKNLPSTTV